MGAGCAQQQGAAVCLLARDMAGGDGAVGAGFVFDDEGRAGCARLGKVREFAGQLVGAAAGGKRHYQGDQGRQRAALRHGEPGPCKGASRQQA
ncbi:hypothetical protein D3C72_1741550 [compost metagenome]